MTTTRHFALRLFVPSGFSDGMQITASSPDALTLNLIQHGWTMVEQERQLQELENRLPLASGEAFAAARAQVLASGQSVLQTEAGFIVRVFPDGRKQRLKPIDPPTPVTPGTILAIR